MATRDLVSLVFTANDKQVQQALTRTGKGLDGLGGQAEKSGGRVQKSFNGAGNSVKGLAGQIPGVGGALSSLTSPAGIATVAIGAVVAGIGAAVGKVTSLEKELRPMIQRSNLSAESLQVLSKAANVLGSEDGLDGVTDSAQELQLRLAEASQDASGPAVAAFEKLGLSSADLIEASPEESFLAVITALQAVTNASDKKFLADELLGGSSEKLSGVINASSEEFQGLTDSIRENGDIISNEGIADANEFNLAMGRLSGVFGGIASKVGTAVIPILTKLLDGVSAAIPILKDTFAPIWEALLDIWVELQPALTSIWETLVKDLLPALQKIWNAISPVLIPAVKILAGLFGTVLKTAFGVISGAISLVASLLTGDFAGAWKAVQKIAQAVMNGLIGVYNNTIARLPGVSKIDMVTFADNVEVAADAVEDLGETAVTSSETTATALGNTAQAAVTSSATTATAMGQSAQAVEDAAQKIREAERQLTIDWAAERKKRLQDALDQMAEEKIARDEATAAEAQALLDRIAANKKFRDDELEANKTAWGITDVEYKIAQASLATLSADKYAALIEQAEAFGVDDLALLAAHNRKLAQEVQAGANAEKEIFRLAHEFIKANGAAGFAAYVVNMEQNLAAGVVSAQQAATLIAEALGRAQGAAAGGGLAPGEGRDNNNPSGRRRQGSKAGLSDAEVAERLKAGDPFVDPYNGTIYLPGGGEIPFGTTGDMSDREKAEHNEKYQSALAIINAHTPGAQHGAVVLPRTGGTRVNVGEAGQAEAVIPLPDLAALAGNLMAGMGGGSRLGGGMGSGAGGGREVVLALDGERLGSVFLDQFNILQSENRLLVDLV